MAPAPSSTRPARREAVAAYATRAAARIKQRERARRPRGGRYGLLLIVLIVSYLQSAFTGSVLTANLQVCLIIIALLLALRSSPLPSPWPRVISGAALIGSVGAVSAALTDTEAGRGVAEAWTALILLFTAVLIVRRVLARPTVTAQSIYGALSAYLIVGMMFASIYAAAQHLGGMAFFAGGQPGSTQTFQYFSFTTLTTLGYGDFTALHNGGRALAVLEALTGQIFLATLVARLVAAYRSPGELDSTAPSRPRPPRGTADGTGMSRHRARRSTVRRPADDRRPRRRGPTVSGGGARGG